MYLDQLVELAGATELCAHPLHPCTNGLLDKHGLLIAVLSAYRDDRQDLLNTREVPSALAPPSGCRCHTRCRCATPRCAEEAPIRKEVAASHSVTRHHYGRAGVRTVSAAGALPTRSDYRLPRLAEQPQGRSG